MQWTDQGIVLGVRRHGETSVILELMTREHGRHLGLVHGGRSKTLKPVLQPGNTVQATWRARLDEHLGSFQVEGLAMRAAHFMGSPLALYGLATMAHLLRCLPERDPHPALYETLSVLVDHLDDRDLAPALFVRFELAMLAELGFGLDLSSCAATGARSDLIYVSPKSGRAVSAAAGEAYKDRLLRLPGFLIGQTRANRPRGSDIRDGFALTDFFLHQNVFDPRGQPAPEERARFVALATAEED
ncbi:DNA repair protein RecO [Microvirga thermotolerans]|uniref:DNA repair protein RecO n=1 Tax=Microvirga thermotolerans TaxID=2651334 RepID=A0A5P9JXX7_9HYPH|nr:DNA repair protein RecO [Microvirga thermotolerans]QFU16608.1 DNA repair protein RecO [Microvirga thermotolerans]